MARQGLDRVPIVADRQRTWVDRLPQWLRPFAVLARWDRPIGTWLLLWPCWWAVALTPGWPELELLALLRRARRDIGTLGDESLDDYLARTRVSREVRERFVVPLAAALWSLAPAHCGEFPAVSYFRFLDQHGMLSLVRPLPWRTIVGGSRVYASGGGPALNVYQSATAGKTDATLATWYVDDIDQIVDELASSGVEFVRYEQFESDARGISPRAGGGRIAWFRDPDGNTFAIEADI